MDITSSILQGVTRGMDFQGSMAKKADAISLLTGTLTGAAAAGEGADALSRVVLQSSMLSAGGSAAVKLMIGQDPHLGHTVDYRA